VRPIEERAVQAYRDHFRVEPVVVASAPGRVNLIGEHTDYNAGFVLPCAVDCRIAVAVGLAGHRGMEPASLVYSVDFAEARPLSETRQGCWADYPSGVVWVFRQGGYVVSPFQGAFAGDVPRGAGLSSSAAIEAATALALDTLFQFQIARRYLAVLCQRAENLFVGVNSGIMDQYASLLCQQGMALLIDCRSLAAESVPLDLARAGLALLACDTRESRKLDATGYNDRRQACERAARTLGVPALRDAQPADLDRLAGEDLKRARHVVTENARVLEAVEALRRQDFAAFGRLMYASHQSLRDDYEVSTPALDAFVDLARQIGALGARLTGAGFGGCAIALVQSEATVALAQGVRQCFAERQFAEPAFYTFQPAAGAEVMAL